ncbi:MAG: hypothetical protein FWE85_03280 [Clostridiales bacterium]|nr:hypothetical protein [Clostridiales bacterium]
MRIEVNLLGQLHCYSTYNLRTGLIECPEGSNLEQVAHCLGLPLTEVSLAVVDGNKKSFSYQPKEGDRVSFFPVIVSG